LLQCHKVSALSLPPRPGRRSCSSLSAPNTYSRDSCWEVAKCAVKAGQLPRISDTGQGWKGIRKAWESEELVAFEGYESLTSSQRGLHNWYSLGDGMSQARGHPPCPGERRSQCASVPTNTRLLANFALVSERRRPPVSHMRSPVVTRRRPPRVPTQREYGLRARVSAARTVVQREQSSSTAWRLHKASG